MRRFFLALLTASALALSAAPVQAATFAPLTLEQQAKKAQVIVRAVLGEPQTVTEGDVVYLAYPLDIREIVAGNPATLPQLEGKPALLVLKDLQDMPALAAKQEAIALLYSGKFDSPLVGFSQGWYPVVDEAVKAGTEDRPITDPDVLRDALRAAQEAQ